VLGEEIYFASKMPWIWGTIDQLHGQIDVRFGVKGTKGKGEMRFKSERRSRMGYESVILLLLLGYTAGLRALLTMMKV
jgi:hypothetical protein